MPTKINYYRKSVLRFSNINLKFDEAGKKVVVLFGRNCVKVSGYPK